MNEFFSLYNLLTLSICLAAGIGLAWLLYANTKHLHRNLRYGLAALRAISFFLILWLLFAPLIRNISYTLEKPILIIGQDNSMSIDHSPATNFNKKQYQKDLEQLKSELGKKYDVRAYSFSDSTKTGFDFSNTGKITNASSFANMLEDELLNRNVGAVIIASDGIFNRGGNPSSSLIKLNAPVYTIALGDTVAKKDLVVANVNYNDLVYVDNEFVAEVQVQAFQSKGERTMLSVSAGGAKVYQQAISITDDLFVRDVPVRIKAAKLGLQRYTVTLSSLNEELSVKNNSQSFYVEAIEGRQKVLIAAAGPHPDISVLKQAVASNDRYQVTVALGEALDQVDFKQFGLIVLYQLPSTQVNSLTWLKKIQSQDKPLWYILGAQTNIASFNQVQQLATMAINGGGTQEAYSYFNSGFTAFDIPPDLKRNIDTWDPLQTPFGKLTMKGSGVVLLNQRIGKVNTEYPQLFFMTEGGKKTGFLAGEGLWRWKLAEAREEGQGNDMLNDLISKSVQYLTVKDDTRKFKVFPSKPRYDENEEVILNANLYDAGYDPVNTADVNVQIKNEGGKQYNFTFSRNGSGYQLNAGRLPVGNYAYVATTTLGKEKYTANGGFFINPIVAEYQQTIANHQLLYNIAADTKGKMYAPKDLLKIAEDIQNNDQIKTLSYEDRRYEDMINLEWLFFVLIVLLSAEWLLRKRNGEL